MAAARASGKNAYEADNSYYIDNQRQQAAQIVRQQEDNLDVLSSGVTRLGERAKNINTEVEEQNAMLEDLDEDLDKAAEKMNVVMGSLAKLLKTKGSCDNLSFWCLECCFWYLWNDMYACYRSVPYMEYRHSRLDLYYACVPGHLSLSSSQAALHNGIIGKRIARVCPSGPN